ncbi:MAG: 23S rRNA (guanosine(2251)-2'-O)-methyltransferase RlmB [Muribaculaceae bacterium]|nr:23S rRNA (guanosine(2251)-2'-O)-methyltransferase RlmB [Muribaculaceae bacterium]
MESNEYIFGLHAVIEAIEAGRDIDKILVKKDVHSEMAARLHDLARTYHIPMQRVPVEKLNRITRKNHQGVIALLSAVPYQKLEDIVPQLYEDGIQPFLLILDGVTDVRNFGGMARTAECCGVNAIVIPERGSVTVNADAVKTSAGALHYLPVCRERNLYEAVRFLKDNGYQVVAATEKADYNYTLGDYTNPVAIVMGAEDHGISPDVLKLCDTKVSIPMFGHIGSLNVGVAAAVMMYEVVRQRLAANLEVI